MKTLTHLSRRHQWIIFIILFCCYQPPSAATETAPQTNIGTGQLRTYSREKNSVRQVKQATLLATDASINANAISTAVTLTQTFKNHSEQWVEGVYVFPLPENAAVDSMTLRVGEKTIIGKIRAKQQAKKIYRAAVNNGQKAALVEQSRDNLFTAKAGNIPPHSEVSITLHYVQPTAFHAGQFSLRLPTTYTPRYIVRNDDTDIDDKTDSTVEVSTPISEKLPTAVFSRYRVNPINIRVQLDAGHSITLLDSPSHAIQKTLQAHHHSAEVTLQQKDVAMDKDFILTWSIAKSQQPLALAFSESYQNKHFTSLLFIPPTLSDKAKKSRLPRETVFIIDTSGSMSGAAMRQAKAGALAALDYLREGDAFNLVAFNSDYSLLFARSKAVSEKTLAQARHYIHQLSAGGGTNMRLPLSAILNQQPLAEHFRQVVFLTDGAVDNERTLFALIHEKLGKTRLFTIGIGAAPNSFFMRQAAKWGRGHFTYIGKIDEVGEKISALFKQLQFPQLTDIRIAFSQQSQADMYPSPLADLYLGEPIVAHIKTPQSLAQQEITVSGLMPSEQGQSVNRWFATTTARQNTIENHPTDTQLAANSGLAKLWAREKINHLKTLNITSGDFNRHNAEILQLGLDYQLVTSQTSFVAIEEKISRDTLNEPLHKQSIANQMPAGNSMSFPTTATSSTLSTLLGSLLVIISLVLALLSRYRREYSDNVAVQNPL